ncbi:MAG: tetratricopeptide repeat protein, partial [Longimicrobiales bacterium]
MTEALQQEIRTLRSLVDSPRDPGGRVFAPLADAYRRAGRVPEALRLLNDGLAKHPDFATAHVVAACLYVEQGLGAEGALAARRALALDAENVLALRALLRTLDETGDAEAEDVRGRLLSLEPDFTPDWGTASAGAAPPLS